MKLHLLIIYWIQCIREIINALRDHVREVGKQDEDYFSGQFAFVKIPIGRKEIGFLYEKFDIIEDKVKHGIARSFIYAGPLSNGFLRDEFHRESCIQIEAQDSKSKEDFGKFFTWANAKLQEREEDSTPKKILKILEAKKEANKKDI